jgi:S1-C subfamily serine protease
MANRRGRKTRFPWSLVSIALLGGCAFTVTPVVKADSVFIPVRDRWPLRAAMVYPPEEQRKSHAFSVQPVVINDSYHGVLPLGGAVETMLARALPPLFTSMTVTQVMPPAGRFDVILVPSLGDTRVEVVGGLSGNLRVAVRGSVRVLDGRGGDLALISTEVEELERFQNSTQGVAEGSGRLASRALAQLVKRWGDELVVSPELKQYVTRGQPDVAARPPAAPASRAPETSSASGVLLKNTNLVLTNYHAVRDKSQVTLKFPSGEEYQGRVAFRDSGNDLALVEVQGLRPTARGVVLAVGTEPRIGETVHALGYPLGAGLSRSPSMVSGAISSTVGLEDDIARFRTTAPINPGNSGGPIVNARGQIIGIAVAGLVREGVEAIRFGIKASTASLILRQARVPTTFDVAVTPAPPREPDEIFGQLAPDVVLIETR